MQDLSSQEILRYQRHLILPQVGHEGQAKLKEASALVVGAGGLGAPVLQYLAAAGVGNISILDGDVVEESNLQRQVLFTEDDLGQFKAQVAAQRLGRMNPHIKISHETRMLTAQSVLETIRGFDCVVDCTDNFPTRYALNDACVIAKVPLISAAIFRFEGQLSIYAHPDGPCYRCFYPKPPPQGLIPDCASGGVFGVLAGVLGTMQAVEVIKLILGVGDLVLNRLVLYDSLKAKLSEMKVRKNPNCPYCASSSEITDVHAIEWSCPMKNDVEVQEISVEKLKEYRDSSKEFTLLDVREPFELEIARIDPVLEIPLGELESRISELSDTSEIVIMCRSGKRSASACEILMQAGFKDVKNLSGGILEWSARIDPSIRRY